MNLQHEEAYFRQHVSDPYTLQKINSLLEQIRQLREENDWLTALNRHYYHTFYPGNIEKMEQDFKYLFDLNME